MVYNRKCHYNNPINLIQSCHCDTRSHNRNFTDVTVAYNADNAN